EPDEARDEKGLWNEMKELERSIGKSALLIRDPEMKAYIDGIVCRVAADYCNDFRVYVIRNSNFNASMTATGMMQIWTGLIVRSASTDEIAAVVGHEIAHYTRLHSLERFRALRRKMTSGSVFDIVVTLATGVASPFGQMTAILSALSFSREQETEADLLGTILVADAAYDPHATYRVWERIIEEEESAAVKRQDHGMFARTHPASHDRADYLKSWVTTRYGVPDQEQVADEAFLDILNKYYPMLMEDQIATNRFGRTKALLERHAQIGVNPSLVRYFYGEMFRQRGEEGDAELAISAYRHSIELGEPPPEAYSNLGYLLLKCGDLPAAQDSFRAYLEADPEASDRAMIEFYLEEEQ
ncbi:MAG: M48 family metalloprotease, partial [Proteobacteria bacterium]|nr:M48 family metalloprotease [Pseudomonadota bacterium]